MPEIEVESSVSEIGQRRAEISVERLFAKPNSVVLIIGVKRPG